MSLHSEILRPLEVGCGGDCSIECMRAVRPQVALVGIDQEVALDLMDLRSALDPRPQGNDLVAMEECSQETISNYTSKLHCVTYTTYLRLHPCPFFARSIESEERGVSFFITT